MKFTTEQQMKIAKYAIDHGNDFKTTGEKNGISYQQVAAWVRKYNKELSTSVKPTAKKTVSKKATKKQPATKKKVTAKKQTAVKATVANSPEDIKKTASNENEPEGASTLDVLSRRDPVLEKQLEDVKRRLGLI